MKPLWPLLALCIAPGAAAAERPAMPEPGADDRVLVIAPHPDDGTLCCAGYVQRAIARGAHVGYVWLTAGDGFTIDAVVVNRHVRERGVGMIHLGLIRVGEALAATKSLGIARADQYMLGYPDGGLDALLKGDPQSPYISPHTRSEIVPYGEALSFGQPVTGANVVRDLTRAITEFTPTIVFAPHPGDIHPDHSATGVFAQRVLAGLGELRMLHRYVIHAPDHYPSPRGFHPDLPHDPPAALAGLDWSEFAITSDEQQRKLQALRLHHTQWEVMRPYLEAFVRRNELFETD